MITHRRSWTNPATAAVVTEMLTTALLPLTPGSTRRGPAARPIGASCRHWRRLRASSLKRRRRWPVAVLINCSGPTGPGPPEKPPPGPQKANSAPEKHHLTVGSPASQAENGSSDCLGRGSSREGKLEGFRAERRWRPYVRALHQRSQPAVTVTRWMPNRRANRLTGSFCW